MGVLDELTKSLGQPTVKVEKGSTGMAEGNTGTYAPLSDGVLLKLSEAGGITSNALIVLGRPFTLADAEKLWEHDEIESAAAYRLITKKEPPSIKTSVFYGTWQPSPPFGPQPSPQSPTYQIVDLRQSETWKLSNNRRGTFSIETRPRLVHDSDTMPPALGLGPDLGVAGMVPSHGIFIGAKGADGKRSYAAAGVFVRFFSAAVGPLDAGVYEWRYVLTTSRVTE